MTVVTLICVGEGGICYKYCFKSHCEMHANQEYGIIIDHSELAIMSCLLGNKRVQCFCNEFSVWFTFSWWQGIFDLVKILSSRSFNKQACFYKSYFFLQWFIQLLTITFKTGLHNRHCARASDESWGLQKAFEFKNFLLQSLASRVTNRPMKHFGPAAYLYAINSSQQWLCIVVFSNRVCTSCPGGDER